MVWSWAAAMPPSPEAPARARGFVEASLRRAFPDLAPVTEVCEDLTVIVSELVTNAVQAATTTLAVELHIDGVPDAPTVRLAVTDAAAGMPTVTGPAAVTQSYGRGLAIVAALSADWGVMPVGPPAAGKTVWARLPLPVAPRG